MTEDAIQTEPTAVNTPVAPAQDTTAASEGAPSNAATEPNEPRRNSRPPRSGRGGGQRPTAGQEQQQPGRQQGPQGQRGQQPHQGQRDQRAPRPARQVHPVLEQLFELHPKLFGARFLPLKLGTYEDLIARHPDTFKTEELKVAMGLHARSTRYLESVAAGHARHDLDGNAVEPVAPEHVHHAILEVFKRRQARSKDDLRPQLQERIIAAIEASDMPREIYAERVRARDAGANAALDEALAELGRQAAKREALLRAFEASGKDEAGFADMYGMDPVEVKRILQRARSDKAAEAERAAAAAAAAAAAEAVSAAEAEAEAEATTNAVPSDDAKDAGHAA
ncbi:ProP effector [Variovorax sp. GrIS 2.14]|uniref:ProQ/FINO family protein n=1 Tax=Variovorax sp. GrIS 2.14 TaxID=3071709 RepID=UPI0038F79E3A